MPGEKANGCFLAPCALCIYTTVVITSIKHNLRNINCTIIPGIFLRSLKKNEHLNYTPPSNANLMPLESDAASFWSEEFLFVTGFVFTHLFIYF